MAIFTDELLPDTRMNHNDKLNSTLGAFHLDMQDDGNLVLYTVGMVPLWASNTVGNGQFAIMQTDGNLVVYDFAERPVFASGTHGNPGAFLRCQDDGNLVIYKEPHPAHAGRAIWATNTHAGPHD